MRRGAEEESSDSDGDVDRPMPRRSDSRIATDFNDYDVLIIGGSVVNRAGLSRETVM